MLGSGESSISLVSASLAEESCLFDRVDRFVLLVPVLDCPRDEDACELPCDSVEMVRDRRRVLGGDGREYEVEGVMGDESPD